MASIDQIAENTTIFKEGDPGKAFHIIAFGEVRFPGTRNTSDTFSPGFCHGFKK